MSIAVRGLPTANGAARNSAMQDLAWSLYNKVDFVFNTSERRRDEQRTGKDQSVVSKAPWHHQTFFNRPHATRRLPRAAGSGLRHRF
jgi:hypothetical protein